MHAIPDRTYKTQWCNFFVRNHACNHGDGCRHVHYSWEKRPKPPAARRFKRVWHTYTWANGWVDWHYTVEPCDPADDPPDDVLPFDVAHHRQRCMLPTGEHRQTYIEMMWHTLAADYCEVADIVRKVIPKNASPVDDPPEFSDMLLQAANDAPVATQTGMIPTGKHRRTYLM